MFHFQIFKLMYLSKKHRTIKRKKKIGNNDFSTLVELPIRNKNLAYQRLFANFISKLLRSDEQELLLSTAQL